jgi:hypothetical protein
VKRKEKHLLERIPILFINNIEGGATIRLVLDAERTSHIVKPRLRYCFIQIISKGRLNSFKTSNRDTKIRLKDPFDSVTLEQHHQTCEMTETKNYERCKSPVRVVSFVFFFLIHCFFKTDVKNNVLTSIKAALLFHICKATFIAFQM